LTAGGEYDNMPLYDYKCESCEQYFELKKSMKDPHPGACPLCNDKDCVQVVFHPPNITYANRPAWTYNSFKHYQTTRLNGGPRVHIDPNTAGDLGAWHCPGKLAPPTKEDVEKAKKKQDVLKKGGYMSDANKAINPD